jgi:hypothetical protein
MTSPLPDKDAIAIAALSLYPPLIRKSLLNDASFVDEYDLKIIVIISLSDNGPTLCRSDLFNAIRAVLSGGISANVTDKEDRDWTLSRDESGGSPESLILVCGQQQITLPEFSEFSGDVSTRIRALEVATSDINLPLVSQQEWRTILEARPLSDFEFDNLHNDISDSPVYLERSIRSIGSRSSINVTDLVPNSRRYFQRLVGTYDGSTSIKEYAVGAGREFLSQLSEWRPSDGFLFSLLLSSHQAITHEFNTDLLDTEQLVNLYIFLEENGDPLSKLGALEVGLRILGNRPELGPFLLRLVVQIRDDDVASKTSQFTLLSALFVMVDGELARTHCLSQEPPFYRRLASLAQAAFIFRNITRLGIDAQSFSDFALRSRHEQFHMQILADMRLEPRWQPGFLYAAQLQAYFFGRIRLAGSMVEASFGTDLEELREIILGNKETSLISRFELLSQSFPGPLDGTEYRENLLPSDLDKDIYENLSGDNVHASSFLPLVSLSLIFNVSSVHADWASEALKMYNYVLSELENKAQLLYILNGLAGIAAVSRNISLANDVRILVRRYRSDSQFGLSMDEALSALLMASASHEALGQWREWVGEVVTELSFGRLDGDEARVLHSRLLVLLHSVPELWVSCARAEAALRSCCCYL